MDVRLWKKKHAQARVRREYRTADEVLAEAAERPQAPPSRPSLTCAGPRCSHAFHKLLQKEL